MDIQEIESELSMGYSELVEYLLDKYGPAKCDYFRNSTCRSKNPGISRTKEGLVCHHIDEDKAIMLSTTFWALKNPYEYQKAERLVYCNILEHLILHYIIADEALKYMKTPLGVGIGGAVNYMVPQINDYYGGRKPAREYERKLVEVLDGNYVGYIKILKKIAQVGIEYGYRWKWLDPQELSKNTEGKVINKVFTSLGG